MPSKKSLSFSVESTVGDLNRFIERFDTQVNKTLADIKAACETFDKSKVTHESLSRLCVNLGAVSVWYLRRGARSILSGDADGWESLYIGAMYRLTEFNLARCLYKGSGIAYEHVVLSALTVLVVNDAKSFSFAMRLYQAYPKHTRKSSKRYLAALARFIAMEAFGEKSDQSVLAKNISGPYAAVFKAWKSNEAEFKAAIEECCDYHLMRRSNLNISTGDTFDDYFHIIPIEIFALRWLVIRQKRSWPIISHPLLTVPIPEPSNLSQGVSDEMFRKFLGAYFDLDMDLT